jgi:serine/threonine-protein kinase HipA
MDASGSWRVSPAYDLTFSSGPGGEQSTTAKGEGKAPGIEHLLRLGLDASLAPQTVEDIVNRVKISLESWGDLATRHGVASASIRQIRQRLENIV